ncbi:hypothetical protein KM043_015825 [Ampulex compressa]|nr:hypothetical protein KM043_015825 [Ampulex compressa]
MKFGASKFYEIPRLGEHEAWGFSGGLGRIRACGRRDSKSGMKKRKCFDDDEKTAGADFQLSGKRCSRH